tara:strand:+ start:15892 stop:16350 length:459 start_codon:yes stop_codon:yes gene_type:complete
MKVVLLENLRKIGSIGEVINVKRGFARNYLIVNNKALYASKENIKKVDNIKVELAKKDQEKKKIAKELLDKLNYKLYSVNKLVTENKELYGSIKPTEISKLILENDKIEIKPSLIQPLNEIKTVGTFKIKIDLHSEIQAEIKLKVNPAEQVK